MKSSEPIQGENYVQISLHRKSFRIMPFEGFATSFSVKPLAGLLKMYFSVSKSSLTVSFSILIQIKASN